VWFLGRDPLHRRGRRGGGGGGKELYLNVPFGGLGGGPRFVSSQRGGEIAFLLCLRKKRGKKRGRVRVSLRGKKISEYLKWWRKEGRLCFFVGKKEGEGGAYL